MDAHRILTKTIKKPSVTNMVMQRVYDALLMREIKPGDLLPSEADLSEQLGVGKSSVREAIKMLSAMGVVESIQGEGTFVRTNVDDAAVNPLTYQMLLMQGANEQILELRYVFEPAYTRLAMEKATDDDLRLMQEAVDRLAQKVSVNGQTARDDLAFHEAVLQATHNDYIIRIGRTILQLFEASISESMILIPEQAVHDHQQILDAFKLHNVEVLNRAVLQSFEGWKQMLNR